MCSSSTSWTPSQRLRQTKAPQRLNATTHPGLLAVQAPLHERRRSGGQALLCLCNAVRVLLLGLATSRATPQDGLLR